MKKLLIIWLLFLIMGCGSKKTKFVAEMRTEEIENVAVAKETKQNQTETKTEKTTENETRHANESRFTNESFTATELTRTFADGSTETFKNPNWNANDSRTNNEQTTRNYSEEIRADLTAYVNVKIDSLGQQLKKEDVKVEDESERKRSFWIGWLIGGFVFLCVVLYIIFEDGTVFNWLRKIWKLIFK